MQLLRQILQDIEVLIIATDSSYLFESKWFLSFVKLASTCTVVLRKPFKYDESVYKYGRNNTSEWLEGVGKGKKQGKKDKKFDRKTGV